MQVYAYMTFTYLWINWHHPIGNEYCCGGLPAVWTIDFPAAHFSQKHMAFSGLKAISECLTTRWSLNLSLRARYEHTCAFDLRMFFVRELFLSSSESIDARTVSRFRLASRVSASIRSFVWSSLTPLELPLAACYYKIKNCILYDCTCKTIIL